MFIKKSCNMSNKDSYIRFFIASIIIVFSFYLHSYILTILALIIFYTAYKKFCFLYSWFRINQCVNHEKYYLSLLAEHKNSPVYIFDDEGNIVFTNKPAKKLDVDIRKIEDLYVTEHSNRLDATKQDYIIYKNNEKYFQVELVPALSEGLIIAYFIDVSEVIEFR